MSTTTQKPLSAAEILAHPAFKTVNWELSPDKSGRASVAKARRGGPFELYWEVHGKGERKMVWIMGLGADLTAWKRQTKHFGHTEPKASKYSSLVFDNRGMGRSDKPLCRYSTSEMARDVIDLLLSIGWIDEADSRGKGKERKINVIGISMGGMIAQELALLIPGCIKSLCLVSTASRIVRTVPFLQNLRERANMFIPRDVDVELDGICRRLFSSEFLARPDLEAEELGLVRDETKNSFPLNQDRVCAGELNKRRDTVGFTKKGFISQAIAAGWHHKGKEDLKKLADQVGRERIAVLHGTRDGMLVFKHAEILKEELDAGALDGEGVEWRIWEGQGHVLPWERRDEFNQAVEDLVGRCEMLK